MKSAKWYLLNLHIWIVLFDYSFSCLTIPFLLLPYMAGHTLGVLRYLGLNTLFQIIMIFVLLGNMVVSIAVLFESRFHAVCKFPGKRHWTRWRRGWMIGYHISAFLSFSSFLLFVPDQTRAVRNMYMKLPCLNTYIYQADNYVLTEDITYHLFVLVVFFISAAAKTLFFAFGLLWNAVRQIKTKALSQKTFNLHKVFLTALGIQTSIPLVMFTFPLVYAWLSILFDYYNQAITNIAVSVLSMHGFTSSWVMVLVHHPYRQALLGLFVKRADRSEEDSKRWFRYHGHTSIGPVVG